MESVAGLIIRLQRNLVVLKLDVIIWKCAVPQLLSGQTELYTTLDSQDASLLRNNQEHQRLCNEAAGLKHALQAKEQVIRWVFQ